MNKTTIQELAEFGQSIWLDNINRPIIESGKLQELIGIGLKGMTSNPAIFDKAIRLSSDYDKKIQELANSGKSTFDIYDDLTVKDVRDAADIFSSVYRETRSLNGYVSLEVNPKLAFNKEETIKDALRLSKKVGRKNVMFKIPATEQGFGAMEELLAQGLNINSTLIFSQSHYAKTAEAFIKGIKRLIAEGQSPAGVHSVASVFVSRIDTMIDKIIDDKTAGGKNTALGSLKGKTASANCSLIFGKHLDIFSGEEFMPLKEKGANIQRVLWASTSTKNQDYSDIKYVTELIGKNTVNTLPEETFNAFLSRGIVKEALTEDTAYACNIINSLKGLGIDIDTVCSELLENGINSFEKSFDALLASIDRKAESLLNIG